MLVAETERLLIRHLRAEDLDDMFEVCGDSELMLYVGEGRALTREEVRGWIEKSLENYRAHGFGCSAVVLKADGRFVGYCGLVNPVFSGEPEAELIYAVKRQFAGRGMASEAARAMLGFAFERAGLRRVVATIDPDNRASIRIAEKLGMRYECRRVDEYNLPELVYAVERADA